MSHSQGTCARVGDDSGRSSGGQPARAKLMEEQEGGRGIRLV